MIKLRLQQPTDAKRFYEILNNPNFVYFTVAPKSVEDEEEWLKQNPKRRRDNTEWNYAIVLDKEVIGGIGVKINFHRKYIGEIGYFIDEQYWRQGIATQAVKLIEPICQKKLKLTRLEILVQPNHTASIRVARNNKYVREGLLKKVVKAKDGKMKDCVLYAKIL